MRVHPSIPLKTIMNLLHLVLVLEWPILVVALALSSWGLSFLIDQRDYKRGSLFPQYGNQAYTHSSTSLSTVTSNATPVDTVARSTYTSVRTLYPNEYGTAHYSSVYSMIGSVPTFQPITKKAEDPDQSTIKIVKRRGDQSAQSKRRAYWADHSDSNSNVYSSGGGESGTFIITFALLVGALAVRVLLTPIYLLRIRSGRLQKNAQNSWNRALVSLTTIFVSLLWGSAISGFYFYCDHFNDTISQSIGLIVTVIFCSIACFSSISSLVLMCMELHKSEKRLSPQAPAK